MAQLIKLQDYISRYETDIYRYPTQYIRLKKQHWDKWKQEWMDHKNGDAEYLKLQEFKEMVEGKQGIFDKVKDFFRREQDGEESNVLFHTEDEVPAFSFHSNQLLSENELKQEFLNQLLAFQLKWASSTITAKSFIDDKYFDDTKLRFLLQRFPDSFLVLYEPVFLVKNAPVDMDIMIATPTAIWCLTFLEGNQDAVYIGSKEHFWEKRDGNNSSKTLNPLIALSRMEKIIARIFQHHQVEFPIKKAVVFRNGYIDYPNVPYDTALLDKRTFNEWFDQQRNLNSPIKHVQLKAVQALLEHTNTVGFKRQGWNDENNLLIDEEEMD
ncbi:nuclease-related domain-containing protein [Falsibacillus pallidus]|uniref:nuclease-related domain-containing protein n=1 Tax=Falsibacillus pallidus TaxID=493781 RepID=UPI003D98BE7D